MTPGPTEVASSTRLVLASAHPHHRTTAFKQVFTHVLAQLKWLWDTDGDVLFISGSGTAGMEAGLRSILQPTHRVVVVTGGKFAERWRDIVGLIGCERHIVEVAWGDAADPEKVAAAALDHQADAVVCVASETSTGVLHPIDAISAAVRAVRPDALLLVDGITAVGSADLSMNESVIDLLVSGSQKSFGLPPGAAFVGLSPRAWRAIDANKTTNYYLDLRRERKQLTEASTAFTPAIPLVFGLEEVMDRWQQAGRESLFAHSAAIAEATRLGVEAMGLKRFGVATPSPALTAIELPEGINPSALRQTLRSRYGVEIAGGQDALKPTVIRIGHLGPVDPFDVIQVLCALEMALRDHGYDVPFGASTAAASRVLHAALSASSIFPLSA